MAAQDVEFAKPEISLGLPRFSGTQGLPKLAGRKRALECPLTGDALSAQRAFKLVLINHVVHRTALMPAARRLARRVIRHSPQAINAILTAVTRGINSRIGEGLQIEYEQFA